VEPVLDPDQAPEIEAHDAVQIVVRPPIDEQPADAEVRQQGEAAALAEAVEHSPAKIMKATPSPNAKLSTSPTTM